MFQHFRPKSLGNQTFFDFETDDAEMLQILLVKQPEKGMKPNV